MKNITEAINNLSEAISYIKTIRINYSGLGPLEMRLKYTKALLEENEEMFTKADVMEFYLYATINDRFDISHSELFNSWLKQRKGESK